MHRKYLICASVHALCMGVLAAYLFLAPAVLLVSALRDPALAGGRAPRIAYRWHRRLSSDYETWALSRVASKKAAALSVHDVSGTEWPIYSSVFYLWTTEALQEDCERDPTLCPVAPKAYAEGAIKAAANLIADPNHATWVRKHWGDSYLTREDLFYRMLLISGLTSYQKLQRDDRYRPLLASQVESLSAELDRSPHGLLNDYPGQCYPIDIVSAIAAIRRADAVLGTDHSGFVRRALRGFEGSRLDPLSQLPAYVCNPRSGEGIGPARGVGIASMLIWAPDLWPDTARTWYSRYDRHFWDRSWLAAGVREFGRGQDADAGWWNPGDVDSGPILFGEGTAASTFGIGAARANGRIDEAYALGAEALVASWPLPNGTALVPRLFSGNSDAPFVGEAIILFNLTRHAPAGTPSTGRRWLPPIAGMGIAILFGIGVFLLGAEFALVRRWHLASSQPAYGVSNGRFLWVCGFTAAGVVLALLGFPFSSLLSLLVAAPAMRL